MSVSLPPENSFPINPDTSSVPIPEKQLEASPTGEKAPLPNKFSKVTGIFKDNFGKITQLLNDHPKYRMILYSTIIAVGIIAMVVLIVTTHGSGMAALGIIPMIGIVGGAGGLLAGELSHNSKYSSTLRRIAGIIAPILVVSAAIALIIGANLATGGSIAMLGSPLLFLGIGLLASTFMVIKFVSMPLINKPETQFLETHPFSVHSSATNIPQEKNNSDLQENRNIQNQRKKNNVDNSN
ncbi:hypothetical protein CLAVI_000008 [Candidatus Clavichlamydia salmonicola]|uniref:IncV family inclusion membrane protein n=1 Tax=Candidatus Clavichlamydia salmonicola TaxID=469812 RepID=UPI0018917DDA|nr:IncV family inclusion membrane protein [Candidatus Clavichlamydia salmonicola]MBF5050407.1 hypothetical protein [Candidatus Clavichlamydia salmonicola]